MTRNLDSRTPVVEDDISILSTPYVPDIEMAQAIKSRLQSREVIIDALDKTIQELCARRDALHRMNAVGQGLTAPIRRVPAEIMAEIFVLCLPTIYPSVLGMPALSRRSGFGNPAPMRQCLGEVCQRWRDILHDTPRAWTGLIFDRSFPQNSSNIQRVLQRSGACPLDIYVGYSVGDYEFTLGDVRIRSAMQLLRSKAQPLHSFVGNMRHTDVEFFLQEVFHCGVISESDSPVPGVIGHTGQIMSPELQSSDLPGPSNSSRLFLASSFLSLRRLVLRLRRSSYTSALFLSFLVHCPQLEAFQLEHSWCNFETNLQMTPSEIKVSLLSLKTLSLVAFHVIEAQDILHCLQVSFLDTVHLDLGGGYDDAVGVAWVFNDCLAPAAASLQHLTLKNVHLTGRDKPWLLRLANLRFLRIGGENSTLDKTIVSAMTHRPSPLFDLCACPKLERLVLEHVWVPGKELLRLARHRTRPDGDAPFPGYFNRLEVYHCPDLRQVHADKLLHMNRASLQFTPEPGDSCSSLDTWGISSTENSWSNLDTWGMYKCTASCWEDAED